MYSGGLLTHDFNDDALGTLAVKLGVEDALPRPQIKLARGNRQNHLVMHQQALQVGIAIVFAGLVMAILAAKGRKLFQPLVDVLNQTRFMSDPSSAIFRNSGVMVCSSSR